MGLIWLLALLARNSTALSQSETEQQTTTVVQFAEPRADLYGNEISDAIGDYRVDPLGDLYERHAPDTALLKLGPPGT